MSLSAVVCSNIFVFGFVKGPLKAWVLQRILALLATTGANEVLVSDAAVSPALFVIVFAFGCALEALECHHLSQNN